jgi:proteic killer suppression protein
MQIESIRHKALRRFAETGSSKGLPAGSVDRLRNMLAYIDVIEAAEELRVPPNFGAHQLTGDRKGEWSLTVTKNWRLTFRVSATGVVEDMDLEDYH